MIKLVNTTKIHQTGESQLIALNKINLKINNGEFIAIMGPSGSGKSSLMNIIGFLDRQFSGSYFLNDILLSMKDENELSFLRNEYIGFVFQNFQLLPRLTAQSNVELPLIYSGVKKTERMGRVKLALEKVGLADKLNHYPSQLSGGQKQRVAIARAMINQPKLLLADEPTGALDSVSGQQIMGLFQKLNEEGTTIILVTHDSKIALYANRVISIKDGSIVEDRWIGK
ncbi:ABC transporter ATP-binding protein [Neobacillus sp. PS3-40]|uniref:ABC transporter ATP-binding protein n=1 Tax=Neobacillus sp. PS3-40 TaxID=3070679 RepID=UPI0027E16359|nr:ABC transporter ATP-binding protein [Neobacillus sp. PS3-40]WML46163.1 ABC transporter ATP-binding protein [Neobacillus sp. PS3-40]